MFSMVQNILTAMITSDFTALILGILIIQLIIFAGIVIWKFMHMSLTEKDARNNFRNWQRSKGTFSEPIHRKRYRESLGRYENER